MKRTLIALTSILLSKAAYADYVRPSHYPSIPTTSIAPGDGAQERIITALEEAGAEGLRLRLTPGSYDLGGIHINKSNIFFEVDSRAILKLREEERIMFKVGTGEERVKNFGVFGPAANNKFTVNLAPNNRKGFDQPAEFIRLSNVENFLIRNINILDSVLTRRASIWLIQNRIPNTNTPSEGTVRDIFQANAHRGYGITQIYRADNCFFKNLTGFGGVQLRFETDQFPGRNALINCDGDNIRGEEGQSTVVFSPHWADSRGCDVTNVHGTSNFNSVRIAEGFFTDRSAIERIGRFSDSSVAHIRSTYGTNGTEEIYKVAAELLTGFEWRKSRSRIQREDTGRALTQNDRLYQEYIVAPTSTPVYSFEGDLRNANRGVKISDVTRFNYPDTAFSGRVLDDGRARPRSIRNSRINRLPESTHIDEHKK